MQFIDPTAAERTAIFEHGRDNALQMLSYPAINDGLGEDMSMKLRDVIENSYPLSLRHGRIEVPRVERQANHLGFLVLLDDEVGSRVEASAYFGDLPPEQRDIIEATAIDKESALRTTEQVFRASLLLRPLTVAQHASGHVTVQGVDETVISRGLVMTIPDVRDVSPGVAGSIFIHETHHDVFKRQLAHDEPTIYREDFELGRFLTLLERHAFDTGYAVLKHNGELEDWPLPEEAAIFHKVHARVIDRGNDISDRIKQSTIMSAAIAYEFGYPTGFPTEEEIIAYDSMSLIHI